MFRAASTVEMLKPIALIAGLAILLWSLGLPSLHFANAANVSSFSDTITDSSPSASANHTIAFTAADGLAATETMTLTFPAGFNLGSLTEDDIDLDINGSPAATAATESTGVWGVTISGQVITFTSLDTTIAASDPVVIRIGTNAVDSGTGVNQIANPSSEGSYQITLGGTMTDSGATNVVILTAVTVTATVNTIFNFSVEGLAGGASVNGETSTGGAASTSIPFGALQAGSGNASSAAQMLTVATNAANGYIVTVQSDQAFQSSTGAIIDGFDNGSDTASPVAWGSPDGIVGQKNTYGHWGLISDDTDIFTNPSEFIAVSSTSARTIMTHDGPVNGAGVGQGTTSVLYKVEISALQEAGDDYSTTLTYVATPTF